MISKKSVCWTVALLLLFLSSQNAFAGRKENLDAKVAEARNAFVATFENGEELLDEAEGVLLCPSVGNISFGVGLAGGGCALMVDGAIVDYYRTSGLSFGFQAGVVSQSIALLFMDADSLADFRKGNRKWQADAGAGVAVASMSAGTKIDTTGANILAVPFDAKGLAAGAAVAGSTYRKVDMKEGAEGLLHTFVANAEVSRSASDPSATARMTMGIDYWSSEAERQAVIAKLRAEGTDATVAHLREMDAPCGRLRQVGKDVDLLTCYATEQADGTWKVILTTDQPIGFGEQRQMAEAGGLTVIELDPNDQRVGTGNIQLGAELAFDEENNRLMIKDPKIAPIRLDSVSSTREM